MKKIILAISILIFLISCEKNEIPNYPRCFQSSIDEILEHVPSTSRANLKKYNYEDKIVYVIYRNYLSDEEFSVVNEKCEILCTFGGLSGLDTCINWNDAKLIETIWEDQR